MSTLIPMLLSIHSILAMFLFFLTHANSQVQEQEQAILLQLKQHWGNPPSLDHWTTSNSSYCTWPEVTCTNSTITKLDLGNKNISGTIPPLISGLQNLSFLSFSNDHIIGEFPVVLYNLSKLEILDLTKNYLAGVIPDDIDRMRRLSNLSLSGNNFSGSIPASIGKLAELRVLQLQENRFNGSFPPEIGNLTNLEALRLSTNGFLPSRFPPSFTGLKKLKELWLFEANLIGDIPETIGDMMALEHLDLSQNELTGNIPGSLFTLKNLSVLYLWRNNLSGEIPQDVEALNLTFVDLSQNNLTGTIPDGFGKLQKLSGLLLFYNQLSGEIPESIGRLPALVDLRLFSNNLSGVLPQDFGRYSNLTSFQVASNRLTGRLPEYLCQGGNLIGVIAFDNNLSGELPQSLANCDSLLIVRISDNQFSGNIPLGLWTASSLQYMMIGGNLFTGELPNEVSQNLATVEISDNKFSGSIPPGVGSWRNLTVFQASNNLFTGTIPGELTALPNLNVILLDGNQLTGSLPSEIISWQALNTLNLSRNQLSGQIPEEICFLPGLTVLDLSDNQFSGQIPTQLGSVRLTNLNLSSNHLSGRIPQAYENAAYESSFLNNPGLCSSSLSLKLNPCDPKPQKSNKSSNRIRALVFGTLSVVFVLLLLIAIFLIKVLRRRRQGLNSPWKLSFSETKIMSALTENNLIGSGGSGNVYRVPVATNPSGDFFAVKRIWNDRKLDNKLEQEFLAEVQILSNIRHLNIVKLLCCISNENSKLLVYEYLKNSSLDRWLHMNKRAGTISGSTRRVILDWPKRLHIAVGAAQGLSYLHYDCLPPIIHRDVKSSNILIDSEFNAKIADFGLARKLAKQGDLAKVSAVAGSLGYIAPEYARTVQVNEKVDVYSFGVVLLELTTGKEAPDGDEHTSLAGWALRHAQEGKPVADALDEEIKEPCYLDEMCSVFRLGIWCTNNEPSERPNMRQVLQILLLTSSPFACRGVKNMDDEHDIAPLVRNSKLRGTSEVSDSRSESLEQAVLLQLKQHWGNPPSLHHWTTSNSSYCTWPEVTCTNSSITELDLGNKNISGTIAPLISDLQNLSSLSFFYNYIAGEFPVALYNLSKLEILDLSYNCFTGVIPDDIDRMTKLSNLSLSGNNFSGSIPAAIGKLAGLKVLQLQDNKFNGSIPPEIGNLTNLEALTMSINKFLPSRFPPSFTKLKKLKELCLFEANLIGEIPEMIGDMMALEHLDLSQNEITGHVPGSLFTLKNLSVLYLWQNNLSGEIPQDVEALNLTFVDLSKNNLTGTIPDGFGKLQKLSGLFLFFNQLSGEIPESIGRLPALVDLRVFSNNLSGILPQDFGRYSNLTSFQIASNRLTGRLPEYLCQGGNLIGIIAFDNNLSGELPQSLGNCHSLLIVRISDNQFSGNIPLGLWTASSLQYMMIGGNLFTGELPNEVSQNLATVEISDNKFSGNIPPGVGSWRNLTVFRASNNLLTGTIPRELTALPNLNVILLDGNQLTGSLPSEIISWQALNTLNLSRNQLSGQIPQEIGFLPGLNVLDLSDNQFSGQIPPQLGFLRLTNLNLSSNHLSGRIPQAYENAAYESSFLDNPGLCSSSLSLKLNPCDPKPQKSNKSSNRIRVLVFGTLSVVFVLLFLVALFLIKVHRRRRQGLNSPWKVTSFQKLSFSETKIMSAMTENNLIGSGGSGNVYRVPVAAYPSGDFVAVKRIWNDRKLDQKLEQEFLAEVQILSNIRHLNIVKLLCCISNENSKLLVYEYLKNSSLDRWLHMNKRAGRISGSTHRVILHWPKRLHIAVGAAQGLSYLHYDCLPPIIHRDVKSSNILIDSEFNAKIADFGLARKLAKQGDLAKVSAVAGSLGYIAPEYARTVHVDEKVDVYSFGVVLLELTTGKEAPDGDEHTSLAGWALRHAQEGKPVADALDEEIKEPCYLDDMCSVFRLGIWCTNNEPSERPNMR
ncbi:hypothetical protein Tsubulata_028164, partial [Turnera subulata]